MTAQTTTSAVRDDVGAIIKNRNTIDQRLGGDVRPPGDDALDRRPINRPDTHSPARMRTNPEALKVAVLIADSSLPVSRLSIAAYPPLEADEDFPALGIPWLEWYTKPRPTLSPTSRKRTRPVVTPEPRSNMPWGVTIFQNDDRSVIALYRLRALPVLIPGDPEIIIDPRYPFVQP